MARLRSGGRHARADHTAFLGVAGCWSFNPQSRPRFISWGCGKNGAGNERTTAEAAQPDHRAHIRDKRHSARARGFAVPRGGDRLEGGWGEGGSSPRPHWAAENIFLKVGVLYSRYDEAGDLPGSFDEIVAFLGRGKSSSTPPVNATTPAACTPPPPGAALGFAVAATPERRFCDIRR